nr:hypothetical protein [Tanacetum cinerariifolium]
LLASFQDLEHEGGDTRIARRHEIQGKMFKDQDSRSQRMAVEWRLEDGDSGDDVDGGGGVRWWQWCCATAAGVIMMVLAVWWWRCVDGDGAW